MVVRKVLLSFSLTEILYFEGFLRLFGVLVLVTSVLSENRICLKQDVCSCRESRGLIDLHSLATVDKPTYSFLRESFNYYYNPCLNFTLGNGKTNCTDVAACRYSLITNTYSDLGKHNSVEFGYNTSRGHVFIKYSADKTTTKVYLICSSSYKFDVKKPENNNTFEFELTSPCACPDGCIPVYLSAGTILCIIFVITLATYLVVGMLYKKAVHGAVGIDIIPNVTFWTSLPGLIKDGYLFFISPCLGERVEYKSYERL